MHQAVARRFDAHVCHATLKLQLGPTGQVQALIHPDRNLGVPRPELKDCLAKHTSIRFDGISNQDLVAHSAPSFLRLSSFSVEDGEGGMRLYAVGATGFSTPVNRSNSHPS